MAKEIKPIKFSEGIKDNEINYNFNLLQDQLNNERKSVAGPGICSGFECTLNDFTLKIAKGTLVGLDGSLVYIDDVLIDIERPILLEIKDNLLTINNNRIKLSETPYALNRNTIADNVPLEESGVNVVFSENNSYELSIGYIDGDYVYLNEGYDNTKTVDVFYNTTYKRRDLIYIDKDYKLQYKIGITSPSPSIPEIDEDSFLYKLGYIEVTGFKINEEDGKPYAACKFVKLFDYNRNIYTDSDGKLYICGQPFDGLKTIYIEEPKYPKEYDFWYDFWTNELKTWRHTDISTFVYAIRYTSSDIHPSNKFHTNIRYKVNQNQIKVYVNGIELLNPNELEEGSDLTELEKLNPDNWTQEFKVLKELKPGDLIVYKIERYDGYAEWVSINNKAYIPVQERYIWSPQYLKILQEEKNHDYQHFYFDYYDNRNLLFIPNKNCLSILINQEELHSDQFDEITIDTALTDNDVKSALINHYGYSEDIGAYNEEYENFGVGFKLGSKLDKEATIEVRVTHRVNSNPITRRFQRSATFVKEGTFIYQPYINRVAQDQIFECSVPYRYHENQLEVYLNGIKLIKDIDFIEYSENDTDDKGTALFKFKVLTALKSQDKVSYKIMTNVFSYDHVEGLMKNYNDTLDVIDERLDKFEDNIKTINNKVDKYTEEIRSNIEDIENIETNLESKFMLKDEQIGKDNLQTEIYEGIVCNIINSYLNVSELYQTFDISNIADENDFMLVVNANNSNILMKNVDYLITKDSKSTKLIIKNKDVQAGHQLYLTGVRFFRKDR